MESFFVMGDPEAIFFSTAYAVVINFFIFKLAFFAGWQLSRVGRVEFMSKFQRVCKLCYLLLYNYTVKVTIYTKLLQFD